MCFALAGVGHGCFALTMIGHTKFVSDMYRACFMYECTHHAQQVFDTNIGPDLA